MTVSSLLYDGDKIVNIHKSLPGATLLKYWRFFAITRSLGKLVCINVVFTVIIKSTNEEQLFAFIQLCTINR